METTATQNEQIVTNTIVCFSAALSEHDEWGADNCQRFSRYNVSVQFRPDKMWREI